MEPRKSKKTRSFGEGSKSSRDSHPSLAPPVTSSRPQLKDRVKSAPLIAQSTKTKTDGRTRHASVRTSAREGNDIQHPPHVSTFSSSDNDAQQKTQTQVAIALESGNEPRQMREVTLAVLGANQAGKSTFVQCALDLKRPLASPSATKKVSLDGVVSILRLLEMQISDVSIDLNEDVVWPQTVGGQLTPRVDGVVVLYDVTNRGSLSRIPYVLNAFSKAAVPTVLVSSKCDNPVDLWEIDAGKVEGFCTRLEGVESFQTSATAPETHKRCVSVILRNITIEKNGVPAASDRTVRPRALTTTRVSSQHVEGQASVTRSKHTRAASEVPGMKLRETGQHLPGSMLVGMGRASQLTEHAANYYHPSPTSPNVVPEGIQCTMVNQAPEGKHNEGFEGTQMEPRNSDVQVQSTRDFSKVLTISQDLEKKQVVMNIANSFLDNGNDHMEQAHEVDGPLAATTQEALVNCGSSFDELVDRLLAQPMSKSDGKFAAIFLCFYRKFAAPSELTLAIVHRFQALSDGSNPQISRITAQLRYLAILAQWMSDYPGDFAHPQTRRIVTSFISSLSGNRAFAAAGKEVGSCLDVVSEDDDTEWACSDASRSRANTEESFLSMSSLQSTVSTLNADSSTEDLSGTAATKSVVKQRQERNSATPSLSSSAGKSENQSTGSFQTLLNSVENAQRQAQLLTPIPRNALTKIQWHQLMDTTDDDIARELTRIDWIMFSSIRPRDLVRHVSLSGPDKEKCRSLEHVNRMIEQFNHVAFWVANLILLRDKPKHRAKMLEKFMGIGWKLRQLNNYNSLGAIVAGINGTAVHRLAQTRELVPHQAQKQFMRLEILMGTQKSHAAYRLAWANTSSERIPFLPLHRRDIVLAEDGNRTFLDPGGTCINWKKFEVMGEVVIGIQRSQRTPYPTISRNEEVQKLVLDGKFPKDDDELYERSIQIEGPGVGETRRRFNWFQR